MSSGRVLRWGLFLVLVALIVPIVFESRRSLSDETGDVITTWVLRAAGMTLAAALGIWLLEKIGVTAAGARCRDCRKRIPYNHAYCQDHLKARTEAAREKHRHL